MTDLPPLSNIDFPVPLIPAGRDEKRQKDQEPRRKPVGKPGQTQSSDGDGSVSSSPLNREESDHLGTHIDVEA